MSSNIFADNAPLYWAAGLQVIPLRPGSKRPFFQDWNRYGTLAISENSKASWLLEYPNYNFGLIPGPISGVAFIDIDVWEQEITDAIVAALPKTPWLRVGAKGAVLAYKWQDIKDFRLFESKQAYAERIAAHPNPTSAAPDGVELFASGRRQVVMPPSIHPDTRKPYQASCNLYEVLDQLPPLPDNLQNIIANVLETHGIQVHAVERHPITEFISQGARDNKMISLAGMYAADIRKGFRTLKECLSEMALWGEKFVENPEDDPVDVEKGQRRIIEYLLADVQRKNCTLPKQWSEGLTPEEFKAWGLDILSEEATSVDYADVSSRILMLSTISDPGARVAEIDKVIRVAARSKSITDLEKRSVQKSLHSASKGLLTLSDVRRAFQKAAAGPVEGASHNEIAAAVLEDFPDKDLRFDHEKLYEWNGAYWQETPEGEVVKYVAETYGNLPASKRHSDYKQIYKTICDLCRRPIKTMECRGVNFSNGFLTDDLHLITHNREFGMTYQMPFPWEVDALPPARFIRFLDWAFSGDQECINAVRQAIATTLFGLAPAYQKVVLLYGLPRCGKSTLLKIVSGLFPPCAKIAIPPDKWHEPFVAVNFDGPLLNVAGDIMPKKPIDASSFKMMTSNDPVQGRELYKQSYQFFATPMSWFASNCQINTDDVSEAFLRRFVIIPFRNIVAEEDTDVNFADDIVAEEAIQIIAWATSAITAVKAAKTLKEPSAAEGTREMMRAAINPIRGWVREFTTTEDGSAVLHEEDAFNSARYYNQQRGYTRRMSRMTFVTAMQECAKDFGYTCTTMPSGAQVYEGLKLKNV